MDRKSSSVDINWAVLPVILKINSMLYSASFILLMAFVCSISLNRLIKIVDTIRNPTMTQREAREKKYRKILFWIDAS